jgi:hypothetical protein
MPRAIASGIVNHQGNNALDSSSKLNNFISERRRDRD